MTWGAAGTLFVGSATAGKVYAVTLPPPGAKGEARVRVIASGLREPAGVAFRDGALYVSAVVAHSALRRHRAPSRRSAAAGRRQRSLSRPMDTTAASSSPSVRTASCTCPSACRATSASPIPTATAIITRMNPDGSGLEIFARGLRNTVGFDWDPRTKELWFTDNGRDMAGRRLAARHAQPRAARRAALRLSVLPRRHHRGSRVRAQRPCSEFRPPAQNLGPHVASLGMRFYTGTQFPATIATRSSSPSTARGTAAGRSAIA